MIGPPPHVVGGVYFGLQVAHSLSVMKLVTAWTHAVWGAMSDEIQTEATFFFTEEETSA